MHRITEPSPPAAAPLNPTEPRGSGCHPTWSRYGKPPARPPGPAPPKDKAAGLRRRPCRGPSPRSSRGGTHRGRGASARGSAAGLHPLTQPSRRAERPGPTALPRGRKGKVGNRGALTGPGRCRPPAEAPKGPHPPPRGRGCPSPARPGGNESPPRTR